MKNIYNIILVCLLSALTIKSFGQTASIVTPTGGTGTGNTNGNGADPVCRYFNSMRYQVHYTAAELTSAGIPANSLITAIAWNVTEASGTLGNYTIRMANTAQANDNAHDATASTTVKNAFNYSTTTGYNDIVLDVPFLWNGTSNLLVEVCTGDANPYVTPYGGVQARTGYATSGGGVSGSRTYRVDGGTNACSVNTGTRLSTKPLIRLTWVPNSACTGTPNAGTATISTAGGCNGTSTTLTATGLTAGVGIAYQWQSASSASGPWTAISGATASTLTVTPSETTFYRLVTTCSGSGSSNNTNSVQFTLTTPPADPGFGNNIWNVACYDGNNFNTYKGFYTENNLNFNSTTRWGVTGTPSSANAASGAAYSGCPIPNDNHSFIYKRQGFPSGTYTINIDRDDDYILLINGVQVSAGGCCGWSNGVWSGTLNASSTIEARFREYGGDSRGAITFLADPCNLAISLSCGTSSSWSLPAGTGSWNNLGGPYTTPGNEQVWSFTPSITGSYTFNVTSNSTWVDLYYKSGSCGSSGWTFVDDTYSTGSYSLNLVAGTTYFFLLDDENTDVSSGTLSVTCPAQPAWKTTWVSMNTGSAVWCAGETRSITVTVTNSGTSTWTNSGPDVNIGVKWNGEPDYLVRADANGLVNGATQTYTFSVTAPTTAGFNNLSFDVVNEGNFWFANNPAGVGPGNVVYRSLPITIVAAPNPVSAGASTTSCPASSVQLNGVATGTVISEQFENVANQGWIVNNMSTPAGTASWFQGNTAVFNGQTGGYIGVNFNSVAGNNTISNWLISPEMTINNGDVISFYTRNPGGFADRLQLRLSTNGASISVGVDANSVGDFSTVLLDINPTLSATGYPTTWTQYTATISGLAGPVSGRIAFRYFVTNGGPTGTNSDYVGIDNFTYTPVVNPVWTPGTGLSSTTILNPVASPSLTTIYTLSANEMGCANSGNVTITVNNPTLASAPANGEMVWRGVSSNDWATIGNWWQFNGTSYVAASAAPTTAQNVVIPVNQTCVLNQPNTNANSGNANSLRIENGATLTMGSGNLNVAGNWLNNGTFVPGTGTVTFTGSGTNTISGSAVSHNFNNVTMNKSGEIQLSVPITMSGTLTLTNGRLNIGNFNLDLPTNTISGGNANSYVRTSGTGVLMRNVGASTVNFPVGRGAYNPAALTNSGVADKFNVRVIDNVTDIGTNADSGPTTSMAVVNRTWMVNEQTAGGSNVTLRLNWNGAGEQINGFQGANAFIAHYFTSEGLWDNIGGTVPSLNVIETSGITSFSPFTISSDNAFAPLPVELIYFTAHCQNDDVEVKWSTASEHNSQHFTLQISEDGMNWSNLYVAQCAGFSNTIMEYSYAHKNAARAKNYYRLLQYDYDGAVETYSTIMSNCSSDETVFMTFPNPSVDAFTVVVNDVLLSGANTLTISDASGKVIYSIAVELENGSGSFALEDLGLPAGLYYLQLNNGSHTSRVIKHSFR